MALSHPVLKKHTVLKLLKPFTKRTKIQSSLFLSVCVFGCTHTTFSTWDTMDVTHEDPGLSCPPICPIPRAG